MGLVNNNTLTINPAALPIKVNEVSEHPLTYDGDCSVVEDACSLILLFSRIFMHTMFVKTEVLTTSFVAAHLQQQGIAVDTEFHSAEYFGVVAVIDVEGSKT